MIIKVQIPDNQSVQINAQHIIIIRAVEGGCSIELSNGKFITSVESDMIVGKYVRNAYIHFYRQSE
jgi:hypothetical protein